MTTAPLVHLLCGLNGAGKTTLARDLGARLRTLSGEPGSHAVTEAGVRHLARIFEEPADAEGLRILRIPGV
ncbi:hypothetical protein AB4Y86_12780 [Arthrobacter sp. 2YAF22_2]|uniref:hypothetical protein n=1 Tax=Arthrobacter sp. 2YAF22_2 TaxID=3233029 RepID=UPI003F914F6B